jgi:hypothetical protein
MLFWGILVNSHEQFAAFEYMCRARAALAKKEMEYWLAEAEEWKQIRELSFIQGRVPPEPATANPIKKAAVRST